MDNFNPSFDSTPEDYRIKLLEITVNKKMYYSFSKDALHDPVIDGKPKNDDYQPVVVTFSYWSE